MWQGRSQHRPHNQADCTCSICCRQCLSSTQTCIVHRRRCYCSRCSPQWLIRRGCRSWRQWGNTQLNIAHRECCCDSGDNLGGCWNRTCICCRPDPNSMSSDRKYKQMNCCIAGNRECWWRTSYIWEKPRSYLNKICPSTRYTQSMSYMCSILWSFSDKCNTACHLVPGSTLPDSMCN